MKSKNKTKLKYILTVLLSFAAGQYCPIVVPMVEPAVEAILPGPKEKPEQSPVVQPPQDGDDEKPADSKQG